MEQKALVPNVRYRYSPLTWWTVIIRTQQFLMLEDFSSQIKHRKIKNLKIIISYRYCYRGTQFQSHVRNLKGNSERLLWNSCTHRWWWPFPLVSLFFILGGRNQASQGSPIIFWWLQLIHLFITFTSIYSLSDLDVTSNLIGSLSLKYWFTITKHYYSFQSWWIEAEYLPWCLMAW